MVDAYDFQIATSEVEFERAVPDWLQLWREDSHSTPFQSPYWNLAWWRHLNPGGTLALISVRHRDRLIGLLPLQLFHDPEPKRRTLRFIGAGISDYLDALCSPGDEISWLSSIFRSVLLQLDCNHCELDQLRSGSPVITAASGFRTERANVCPVLHLYSAGSSAEQPVSHRAAQVLSYYRRRLARSHHWEIECVTEQNIDYILSELFRLHHDIWSARGQQGVLYGREIAGFHRTAAFGLLREGALRMYLLKIDGISAACFYGFWWHHRTYYYLGAFSPEFSRLNPGTLLIGHAIEQAMRDGSVEFDFLRGSEQYKYWWGAHDRPTYRLTISRASLPAPVNSYDSGP